MQVCKCIHTSPGSQLPCKDRVLQMKLEGIKMFDERGGRFEGLNRRLSRLFESPRLSATSSSSNEKLSSSSSICSDSDRPLSLFSTESTGSLRESCDSFEDNSDAPLGNGTLVHNMELVTTAAESLQATYREMQNGLKSNHSPNNNSANRRARQGSRSLSPFGNKVNAIAHKLSYVERVVLEINDTERMYVQDLRSIVEEYLGAIIDRQEDLPITPEQVSALFGNIEDIYELNSELLQDLDNCRNNPVAVASCFVEKSQDFDIYTQYCTNYPNSVATLTECMRNKTLAKFFREKQEMLNQSLPLGSYLLKPVQRILKYHLLLQEIAKHLDVKVEGYEVVEEAIETMTGVAWYINDMKRKHEHAVRQQEIQSLLLNWKGIDLTAYGELVLEGTFRIQRARSERTFFLFDKALFITKRRGEHYVYKTHIPCSSLMLIDSARDSLCFSVTHYKNSKQQHNVQAKTVEEKHVWTHHIKKLILENHHAIIPQKAKEAILEMDNVYKGRYKYSPERQRKTIEPSVTQRSGRRQSGLKHAGSDGDLEDISQPCNGSFEQPEAEGEKESPVHTQLSRSSVTEFSASDEEEIQLGDDDDDDEQVADFASSLLAVIHCWHYRAKTLLYTWGTPMTKDPVQREAPKGCKRQNSQSCGNAEKRRSVDVSSGHQETKDPVQREAPKGCKRQNSQSCGNAEKRRSVDVSSGHQEENSVPEEIYKAVVISSSENQQSVPSENRETEKDESSAHPEVHEQVENEEAESREDSKTFSSEEEEEEAPAHESTSILPPSVLDQASVIAERFISSISRRSSMALDDGKVIGYITPRLTSRCSSLINLKCTDTIIYQNGTSDFPEHSSDTVVDILDATLNKANSASTENVFEERPACKRRDSILSIQDRQLLDKIKTYYDDAEHQDASFSIKRRESLNYIPTGLVRNSVFKINSLPRFDTAQSSLSRQRMSSSSSNTSRHTSLTDPISSEPEQVGTQSELMVEPATNGVSDHSAPITDEEFRAPDEMIKVWDEIEKVNAWKEASAVAEANGSESKAHNDLENRVESHEPLLILEDSDLSTIAEESPLPTPESTSPKHFGSVLSNTGFNEYKTPGKLHSKIMQLANCMDEDMSEKMKNKVYQLARQYSQRIKCNKPVPQRQLKEIEEDLRRNSLPAVQEEKQNKKEKRKAILSLPTYDSVILHEHAPTTPTSALSSDKSPKHLSFSTSSDSPGALSPARADCRSPLSPVNAERFHWPDVRELRSRYTSAASSSKAPPVNRNQSVPERITVPNVKGPREVQRKDGMSLSYSMTMKHMENISGNTMDSTHNNKVQTKTEPPLLNSKPDPLLSCAKAGYYVSAEAPLDNNKKVIVMQKISVPTDSNGSSTNDLESNVYVQIRSPTSRQKISLKAVIERCKAYQESEEYRSREEETTECTQPVPHQGPNPERQVASNCDGNQQNRVKNLREKFQTRHHSCSLKQSEVH
ncbi:pleckstrin homology domain-containing family G member 3 isoform X2 [Xenopus laevis]|uniref:Pleckstrin homology domain-containing family G member 3 isoform X2 n=1 Tax=Xenopus laevis TaxID=8355 RepID=A0A8J1LPZ6_XENLA|nr:pleckstrin homology domain-containing family G member 3 isoform X2 [Xenopus laevis]